MKSDFLLRGGGNFGVFSLHSDRYCWHFCGLWFKSRGIVSWGLAFKFVLLTMVGDMGGMDGGMGMAWMFYGDAWVVVYSRAVVVLLTGGGSAACGRR